MALTPESIATTWNSGGTVQIETAADYNVFVSYINSNAYSSSMRNAEIIADLDFQNGEIPCTFYNAEIRNITIDGKGHTIKNVVSENINAAYIFFWGRNNSSDGGFLSNITFENCYISHQDVCQVFTGTKFSNVTINKCRFIAQTGYRCIYNGILENFSSAVTIILTSGDYFGVYYVNNVTRCAILDTVTRDSAGGEAVAIWLQSGSGTHNTIFTRNRFYNFSNVSGIRKHWNNNASTMYSAITAENASVVFPIGGQSNDEVPITGYYDKTLVQNLDSSPSSFLSVGLTTAELQSVSTMQAKGFNVGEA